VILGQGQQLLDAVLADRALLQVGQERAGIDLDHRPGLDQTPVARDHQGRRPGDLLRTGETTFLPDLQDHLVRPGRMLDATLAVTSASATAAVAVTGAAPSGDRGVVVATGGQPDSHGHGQSQWQQREHPMSSSHGDGTPAPGGPVPRRS
jgi:hypothetical protein